MKKEEFLALTDKYLAGTLTSKEQIRFLEACEILQNRTKDWDAATMDDQSTVKARIFGRIVEQIQSEETENVQPLVSKSNFWRYLAAASVLLLCLFALYTFRTRLLSQLYPIQTISIKTEKGKLLKKQLPDGSTVWLNSESTLSFPEKFSDTTRSVTLVGEAYFEVVHDPKQPFVVHTETLNTRVLGTHFMVKAFHSDPQSKVTLLSGRVAIQTVNLSGETQLAPLQEFTSDRKTGAFTIKMNIDSASAMAWANGKLSFRKNRLTEVIRDLERRFDTKITTDSHLENCLIYADVLPGDQLEPVLDQLAISLDGKIVKQADNQYLITGKGCN
jgi:transmembrane sensor